MNMLHWAFDIKLKTQNTTRKAQSESLPRQANTNQHPCWGWAFADKGHEHEHGPLQNVPLSGRFTHFRYSRVQSASLHFALHFTSTPEILRFLFHTQEIDCNIILSPWCWYVFALSPAHQYTNRYVKQLMHAS